MNSDIEGAAQNIQLGQGDLQFGRVGNPIRLCYVLQAEEKPQSKDRDNTLFYNIPSLRFLGRCRLRLQEIQLKNLLRCLLGQLDFKRDF